MTSSASSPTVRHRVLAAELKSLRHSARLTHVDVANRLGWQQGKVSKIESARQSIPVEVVIALAELCHATPRHRDRLVELAKAARVRAWWDSYGDTLTPEWRTYLGLETDADAIELFATETIPELLQTDDYAWNLLSARSVTENSASVARDEQVRRRVEMLHRRQRIVLEDRGAEVNAVLSESALARIMGSDHVSRHQCAYLTECVQYPNVSLRVLPFASGVLAVDGPFTLFRFSKEPHPDVVFVPHRVGAIHLEQQHEVDSYRDVLSELRSCSLSTADSHRLLKRMSDAEVPQDA